MAVSVRRYHVRSSSMPSSRSHPVKEKVEEKLSSQLRQYSEYSLPSTSSFNSLSNGLSGLSELYQSIDDLLQLPQTHQALSRSSNKKCVEEVLDGSLRLLDTCGNARDITMQIADAVKDLQLAMRRRVLVSSKTEILEKGIGTYMAIAKKMKQKASKCLKTLMIKTQKCDSSSHVVGSQSELVEVMAVLKKAMSISINILEQLLCFVSNPKAVPMKKRSSLVLIKWIGGSGRVSCEEKTEKMNEMERHHSSLSFLLCGGGHKDIDTAQEELNTFLDGIQGLEEVLDVLQRRLIQTRVSLLNILSH
ncbi:hypothetical protein H6P81_000512 [Aristolochia fimbriata]|uniref:Uncharacterized protein n=1 Tax=Aristolochia fimbriata TaxID=158543 RepID=A0AAV7F5M9_ARIFI|nr:hypothetical protein H6P81_000512 [Aristolochia fimbriata]